MSLLRLNTLCRHRQNLHVGLITSTDPWKYRCWRRKHLNHDYVKHWDTYHHWAEWSCCIYRTSNTRIIKFWKLNLQLVRLHHFHESVFHWNEFLLKPGCLAWQKVVINITFLLHLFLLNNYWTMTYHLGGYHTTSIYRKGKYVLLNIFLKINYFTRKGREETYNITIAYSFP